MWLIVLFWTWYQANSGEIGGDGWLLGLLKFTLFGFINGCKHIHDLAKLMKLF